MHKSKNWAILAIIMSFSCLAQSQAEEVLDKKLENRAASVMQKVSADDPNLTPREREIKILARQIELQEEIKRLESQKRKIETQSEKRARKEIERREKTENKLQKRAESTISNAQISGCAPDSVWVSPRATMNSLLRVMSVVRVTNSGTLPVDIESPLYGGILVRGLCSGGSITLSFVLRWEEPDQLQIPLTAISRPTDGGVATDQFQTYLNRYDIQYNRVRAQTWMVRVQRQYQSR